MADGEKGKRYFVSGAAGYIGSWLVKELSNCGHTVHALVRNAKKATHIQFPGVVLFEGDILDIDTVKVAMLNCDGVFHLAACAKLWDKNPEVFDNINVLGTKNVLEAALECKIDKLVITSSAGILGPSVNGEVNEDTKRTLGFFNDYERTKALAQEVVQQYTTRGLNIVTVLPTRVYGIPLHGSPESVSLLIKKYVQNKWRIIPGNGKSVGNYSYLPDVIQGHILAMEKGKSGESYILGGHNLSYDGFFEKLASVSGIHRILFHMPYWMMKLITHFLMLGTIFGIEPMLTPDWMAKLKKNWSIDGGKAEKELGYKITLVDEALGQTVKGFLRK